MTLRRDRQISMASQLVATPPVRKASYPRDPEIEPR